MLPVQRGRECYCGTHALSAAVDRPIERCIEGQTVQDEELDEYDIFLQTWEPGERLIHANLPQNLSDPLIRKRPLSDSTSSAPVERSDFTPGHKIMDSDELIVRSYAFFEETHTKWAAEFRDYVLTKGVPEDKLNIYTTSFAHHWVD